MTAVGPMLMSFEVPKKQYMHKPTNEEYRPYSYSLKRLLRTLRTAKMISDEYLTGGKFAILA